MLPHEERGKEDKLHNNSMDSTMAATYFKDVSLNDSQKVQLIWYFIIYAYVAGNKS